MQIMIKRRLWPCAVLVIICATVKNRLSYKTSQKWRKLIFAIHTGATLLQVLLLQILLQFWSQLLTS